MPKWTQQQNDAITARGRNILVSAAAGSGKTAVLVERVKRIITDTENPVGLDKLLIVTFTNPAAAEMKSRISKALQDCIKNTDTDSATKAFYRKQLSLLPSARICTIDSFCANIVREHFFDLEISQDFTMLDDSELQILEDNVINDVLDSKFEDSDTNFKELFNTFTTPTNDRAIFETIKKLLRFIYAQPFPYNWLDDAIEKYNIYQDFAESEWFKYIKNQISDLLDLGISLVNENISLIDFGDDKINDKFSDVFKNDLTEFTRYKNALNKSWNDLFNEREPSFVRMAVSKKADAQIVSTMKRNRDTYKTVLKDEIRTFLISSEEEYKDDIKAVKKVLIALSNITKEVDQRLMSEKKERNAFSFSDIEHFAINLLFKLDDNGNIIKSQIAEDLSKDFYEILVDEYQDTNEAQDLLFTYLSNGKNMFTVGDIKQSIYRFRLAMPHIFNKKRKEYKPYNSQDNEISSRIILDKNFRSRKDICSYVNFVFSNLMSEKLGELDYNTDEYLNCGANFEQSNVPSAQINIIDGVKGEDTDRIEAKAIANMIIEKINNHEQIKDGDSYRDIKFSDFVILMRSLKSHISNYADVLKENRIPVICDNSTDLFSNNEIKMILSLLRTIDNPMQDIPLLATMMSPFYNFTSDDLAQIKVESNSGSLYTAVFNSESEKVKEFINDLSELRKLSVTMSVSSFVRYIVDSKGLVAFVNSMGNSQQRYQNIIKFISLAKSFDSGLNVGLTAFIRYIDKIISSDKSVDSAALSASDGNCVTIMSIHHSKGLEFPVCILAGAAKKYNKQDLSNPLLLNNKYGMAIKCHNEQQLYRYKSIPYSVIADINASELMSENLRVLYVAMTRAKEQFITFASVENINSRITKLSSKIIHNKVSPILCKNINSDADFILLCALLHKDGKQLRDICGLDFKCSNDFDMIINIIQPDIIDESSVEDITFVDYDPIILKQISDKLNYKYNRLELSSLSSKLTASSLDSIENGFEFICSDKPSFLTKGNMTPAQRGTVMHTFMQYCSYEYAKNNLEGEITRLLDNGFVTEEQAAVLDREKLSKFFNSAFAQRIFSAKRIYREIKVSSFISASQLYETDFNDNVLVQGIADCVFEEDDGLVLLDYKTDRINNELELLDRYKYQISFYKKAIAKLFKKPVKSACLYSFYLEKECYYN